MIILIIILSQLLLGAVAVVVLLSRRRRHKKKFTFVFSTTHGQLGTFTVPNERMFEWCQCSQNETALLYILSSPEINWSFIPAEVKHWEAQSIKDSLRLHEQGIVFTAPSGCTEFGCIDGQSIM